MKILPALLIISTLLMSAAGARTIEGVDVSPQTTVSGKTLKLNGAGVRSVKFGPIPIKVYVASFYAPEKLTSEKAVLASDGPLLFNFTFLRSFSDSQVEDAWNAQFKASATYSYSGFEADKARFVSFFGPIKDNGVESVEINGDTTRVYDAGVLKGEIAGRDFQKAFLSMWFGSNPVTPGLKSTLLGQ